MPVDLDVNSLLFEGARRADECARMRAIFPSDDVVLIRTDRRPAAEAIASHMGRWLFDLIDGRRTLGDLILASRAPRFHAFSFLGRQVEIGVLRTGMAVKPQATRKPPDSPLEELRALFESGEYREALDLAERCDLVPEAHDAAGMLVARAEAGFLSESYRTVTPPDAVPCLVGDLGVTTDRSEMGENELFVLQLIDGQWNVRSPVWIAPLRKAEIVRALTRLVDRGYVTLVPRSEAPAAGPPDVAVDASEVEDAVEERIAPPS